MSAVRLSRRADEDLLDIYDYYEPYDPEHAWEIVDDLLDTCDLIGLMPRGQRVKPSIGPGIRLWPHGKHSILYRIEDEGVVVLRIIPAGRDLTRLFDDA